MREFKVRELKELPVKRHLDESTRKQSVVIYGEVFSLHINGNEVIITDHSDYTKIYSIQSLGLFHRLELDSMGA